MADRAVFLEREGQRRVVVAVAVADIWGGGALALVAVAEVLGRDIFRDL